MSNTNETLTKEDIRKREVINLVCRQTDYTREEAEEKLKQRNFNYLDVIKEYMNPNKKPTQYTASLNQQIFKNMRGFLDENSKELQRQRDYYDKAKSMNYEKVIEEKIKEVQENTSVINKDQINKKNVIDI